MQKILSSSLLSKNLKTKIYNIIIFPIVSYGRIFWRRKEEVTGDWRKVRNEDLNDMSFLPNIFRVIKSRRMKLAEQVARMGERRGVYRIFECSNEPSVSIKCRGFLD